ncbi:MAG: LysR family transcriptional regulator [Thalassovita sp.]
MNTRNYGCCCTCWKSNVTRTAEALDMTQPFVSLVLRRFRDMTGDPILVRSGAKLVLTVRGQEMLNPCAAPCRD